METGEKLYSCLKDLIEISRYSQERIPSCDRQQLTRKHWLKEFCTIALRAPRRSGHDYAIYKLIEDNPDKNFAIIAKTSLMLSYMRTNIKRLRYRLRADYREEEPVPTYEDIQSMGIHERLEKLKELENPKPKLIEPLKEDESRIYTFSAQNLKYNMRGIDSLDYVIVNCASVISSSKLEELYDNLVVTHGDILVILME